MRPSGCLIDVTPIFEARKVSIAAINVAGSVAIQKTPNRTIPKGGLLYFHYIVNEIRIFALDLLLKTYSFATFGNYSFV